MNFQRDAVLAYLIDALRQKGSWCGETHVQKSTYFVQGISETNLDLDFILYKHGPYSFDLTDEIASMRAFGFLDWEVPRPEYGPRLRVTEAGKKNLIERYKAYLDPIKPSIDFIASKLADYGVADLERFATALYFRHDCPDPVQRANQIHVVKPHVSEDQALTAIKRVEAMIGEWKLRTENASASLNA